MDCNGGGVLTINKQKRDDIMLILHMFTIFYLINTQLAPDAPPQLLILSTPHLSTKRKIQRTVQTNKK